MNALPIAQNGDVDPNGDIVDRVDAERSLLERLRPAICPESTIDLDAQLSYVVSELARTAAT